MAHFNSAINNAQRIRTVGVKEEDMVKLTPIMHVAVGIAYLGQGNYRDAAISFLATPTEYATLGPVYGIDFTKTVASGNDIAIYGGLCALATMTREELLDNVLGGPFRAFLELEPHMRKAISLYTTAKYQSCIATLTHYYADWSLDIFLGAGSSLGSHVDKLLARIRERSITAYFSSFSQVSLASLAATFPPLHSQLNMENEVLNMIDAGTLNARLDLLNGLLIAPQRETRSATHSEAKAAADEVERMLLLRLHKVNMIMAGLEVRQPKNASSFAGGYGNGQYVG
jgi:COP9 signalosome complex subunit 1